jgi:hypothetical protein
MVECRARVPSPGHDMKKSLQAAAGERESRASVFWLSFFDPFLPVEKFFKKSI